MPGECTTSSSTYSKVRAAESAAPRSDAHQPVTNERGEHSVGAAGQGGMDDAFSATAEGRRPAPRDLTEFGFNAEWLAGGHGADEDRPGVCLDLGAESFTPSLSLDTLLDFARV
eukprot:SAG31_NODE_26172_length_447_cov_0.712644_1_plen_113_part_01